MKATEVMGYAAAGVVVAVSFVAFCVLCFAFGAGVFAALIKGSCWALGVEAVAGYPVTWTNALIAGVALNLLRAAFSGGGGSK